MAHSVVYSLALVKVGLLTKYIRITASRFLLYCCFLLTLMCVLC